MEDASPASEYEHFTHFEAVPYGVARQNGQDMTLYCSLHLPKDADTPPPLFVWFHGGAFKFGEHGHKMSRRLGRRLTRMGIAVASVQYRLRGTAEDLAEPVLSRIEEYQSHREKLIRAGLCEYRSFVALEDGVRFLSWASGAADRFGWSGKRVLGGSSAGGLTAYNIAFGAERLGLGVPDIQGVFACSGGFNYPDLVTPRDGFRSLALHNPNDRRVSIAGVRMLKHKLGDRLELLESEDHIHGHCELFPGETKSNTYGRIATFIHETTA